MILFHTLPTPTRRGASEWAVRRGLVYRERREEPS
jgi:hypothetical protein